MSALELQRAINIMLKLILNCTKVKMSVLKCKNCLVSIVL